MKKFIVLLISLVMPFALFGQTYSALWKKVREAGEKDLPQTQYEVLQQIVKKATKEKAYGQLLEAELGSAQAMTSIAPDSLKPAMERLSEHAEATKDVVLKTIYQTVLYKVYCSNAYALDKLSGGREVRYKKPELTEELCRQLAQVKDKTYDPFVKEGADSKIFDHDMLIVVGAELDDYEPLYNYYQKAGNRAATCLMAAKVYQWDKGDAGKLDSLMEVYGDLPLDRPDLLFTEQTPLRASSPYSVSKASADLLALAYHRTYGLPVTISRCSNNYGPYQFPEKLIPLMINNALHDRPLPVYGRGVNVRDWLYVRDHCLGILAALEKGRVGQVYNLGGHNEKSNIEIVRLILAALGKPESLITFVTDRKGHDLRYAIDPSKAAAELGWQPSVPFEEGIGMTVGWYLEHMDWLEECTGGEYVRYYDQMYGDRDAEPGTLR